MQRNKKKYNKKVNKNYSKGKPDKEKDRISGHFLYTIFLTLFALRQEEQTLTDLTFPSISAFILLRFGKNFLLVALRAWLLLLPVWALLPQISHTLDIIHLPINILSRQKTDQLKIWQVNY